MEKVDCLLIFIIYSPLRYNPLSPKLLSTQYRGGSHYKP